MSTRLHNGMDARKYHVQYRYGICNDMGYNRKTCPNIHCMYGNTIICKINIIYLSCCGILIFFYAYQTYLVSHLSQELFVRISCIRSGKSYTYVECPYLDDD